MHGVSRLWVIGFDIADVLVVPGVYASTGLSYILLITRVAFQALNTTGFCWLYGFLGSCFCIVLVVLKAIFILGLLNRLVIFLTAGPKKVKGVIMQYSRSPDLSQNNTARLSVLHTSHIWIISNNYSKYNLAFRM